jgi:hypothetical protein
LIDILVTNYRMALDTAESDGLITARLRQRLADRIGPQFAWLVDYATGDPLGVAVGDVIVDGAADMITNFLPGDSEEEQGDSLVRLVLGLPVAGLGEPNARCAYPLCGGYWLTIGPDLQGALSTALSQPAEETYAEYLAGMSLVEIIRTHGGDPEQVMPDYQAAGMAALAADVAAGRITGDQRREIEAQFMVIVVVGFKHHHGDPLPNDFTGTTFDDEAAA